MNLIEVTVHLHIDSHAQKAIAKLTHEGRTLTGERALAETGHRATTDVSNAELTLDIPADVDVETVRITPTQTFSGGRYGVSLEADGIVFRVADFNLDNLGLELID